MWEVKYRGRQGHRARDMTPETYNPKICCLDFDIKKRRLFCKSHRFETISTKS